MDTIPSKHPGPNKIDKRGPVRVDAPSSSSAPSGSAAQHAPPLATVLDSAGQPAEPLPSAIELEREGDSASNSAEQLVTHQESETFPAEEFRLASDNTWYDRKAFLAYYGDVAGSNMWNQAASSCAAPLPRIRLDTWVADFTLKPEWRLMLQDTTAPVVLVSCGCVKQPGSQLVRNSVSSSVRADERLIHRVDLIFDSREHLCERGDRLRAQEEFLNLYSSTVQPFFQDALDLICHHMARADEYGYMHILGCLAGHHRSVVCVEIEAALLAYHFPNINVIKWHLDHSAANRAMHGVLLPQDLPEYYYEADFEFPLVNATRDPPTTLLHTQH